MKIKIISNPAKDWTSKLAQDVRSFLTENDHSIVGTDADATICIGGDGTILYANYQKKVEGPILGIGTKKSYICQLERKNWNDTILQVLSGDIVSILSIKASIDGKEFTALNDFVIHAKNYRVIEIAVADSDQISLFRGDGLIVSSALGSSAYAYSAGGTQLPPDEQKMVVVPIAPYKRAFSPEVLPSTIKLSISSKQECAFISDGILVSDLPSGTKVNIEKGDDILFFAGVGHYKQR